MSSIVVIGVMSYGSSWVYMEFHIRNDYRDFFGRELGSTAP